jgi:hypothetical protein
MGSSDSGDDETDSSGSGEDSSDSDGDETNSCDSRDRHVVETSCSDSQDEETKRNEEKALYYVKRLCNRHDDIVWDKLSQLISQDETLILILAESEMFAKVLRSRSDVLTEAAHRVVNALVQSPSYGGVSLLSRYPLLINGVLRFAISQIQDNNDHSYFDLVHPWIFDSILSSDIPKDDEFLDCTLLQESVDAFLTMVESGPDVARNYFSHPSFLACLEKILVRIPPKVYSDYERLCDALDDVLSLSIKVQDGCEQHSDYKYKCAIADGNQYLHCSLPLIRHQIRKETELLLGIIAGLKEVRHGNTNESLGQDLIGHLLVRSLDSNNCCRLATIGAICWMWLGDSREDLEKRCDFLSTIPELMKMTKSDPVEIYSAVCEIRNDICESAPNRKLFERLIPLDFFESTLRSLSQREELRAELIKKVHSSPEFSAHDRAVFNVVKDARFFTLLSLRDCTMELVDKVSLDSTILHELSKYFEEYRDNTYERDMSGACDVLRDLIRDSFHSGQLQALASELGQMFSSWAELKSPFLMEFTLGLSKLIIPEQIDVISQTEAPCQAKTLTYCETFKDCLEYNNKQLENALLDFDPTSNVWILPMIHCFSHLPAFDVIKMYNRLSDMAEYIQNDAELLADMLNKLTLSKADEIVEWQSQYRGLFLDSISRCHPFSGPEELRPHPFSVPGLEVDCLIQVLKGRLASVRLPRECGVTLTDDPFWEAVFESLLCDVERAGQGKRGLIQLWFDLECRRKSNNRIPKYEISGAFGSRNDLVRHIQIRMLLCSVKSKSRSSSTSSLRLLPIELIQKVGEFMSVDRKRRKRKNHKQSTQ